MQEMLRTSGGQMGPLTDEVMQGRFNAGVNIDGAHAGVQCQTPRRYGRAPGGGRIEEATPAGDWRTLTLLGGFAEGAALITRADFPRPRATLRRRRSSGP